MASLASDDVPTIVIPYRNREDHLQCALARFRHFPVIVVEQMDDLPFNRGSLLNSGYVEARRNQARRIILHDVDLIPDDTLLRMYAEPWPRPVVHFGALFTRYNNSASYFGGVHGFTTGYFPGYPNHYFGWGGEDDALRLRVRNRDMTYARQGCYLDLEGYARPRDKLDALAPHERCQNKWELLQSDDRTTDNHRMHSLDKGEVWEVGRNNVLWGKITHRRAA